MSGIAALFAFFALAWHPHGTEQPQAAAPDADLERVAAWMTGSFDTFGQVERDTAQGEAYVHLRAVMRVVPVEVAGLSGPGARTFYVEQAAADSEATPYRQRVLMLTRRDGVLVNRVFKLVAPERMVGAWVGGERLSGLARKDLALEEGCDLVWTRIDDGLYTGLAGLHGQCRSSWRGGAYAVSQVLLRPDELISLDQGFDASGVQVWGPKPGIVGHRFVRRTR
ncbi:MAG: chromophore lyase CpcT/CpeT [Acidobacteriota bacterium]